MEATIVVIFSLECNPVDEHRHREFNFLLAFILKLNLVDNFIIFVQAESVIVDSALNITEQILNALDCIRPD